MAAVASGVRRAQEVSVSSHKRKKRVKGGFNDLSTRTQIYRSKLIEEFRLLDLGQQAQSSHAPVFDAGTLFAKEEGAGTGETKQFRRVVKETPHQMVKFKAFRRRRDVDGTFKRFGDKRMTRLKNVNSPPLGLWAHYLLSTNSFQGLILFAIVMNSIVLGVQAELQDDESKHWMALRVLEFLDLLALYVFVLEIILKWLDNFREFWRDGWNIFDFVVTVLSALPLVLEGIQGSQGSDQARLAVVAKQLRLLRVLRTLKLLVRFTGIRIIVQTTLQAFESMAFILMLLSLVTYIFAVAGISLFEDYTTSHQGGLLYQDKFRGMGNALVTLFQLMTLDRWYSIQQDIAKVVPVWLTVLYFVSWIFVASFAFKNIFVGVMVKNFAISAHEMKEERRRRRKRRKIRKMYIALEAAKRKAMKQEKKRLKRLGRQDSMQSTVSGGGISDAPSGMPRTASQFKLLKQHRSMAPPGMNMSHASVSTNVAVQATMARVQSYLVQRREESLGWETMIAQNLHGLKATGRLETLWPRDTLFQYMQDMQALQENMREYQELQYLATLALYEGFDT